MFLLDLSCECSSARSVGARACPARSIISCSRTSSRGASASCSTGRAACTRARAAAARCTTAATSGPGRARGRGRCPMRRNVVAGWHACHAASHLARLRAIVRRRLVGAAVVLALWWNDTIAECAVVEVGRGMCARGSSAAASSSIVLLARPPPLFARSTSDLAYSGRRPARPSAPTPPSALALPSAPALPPRPPRYGLAAGAVPSRRTRSRSARCASTTRTRAASPRRVQQQHHVNRLYSAHHESFVVRGGVPKVPRGSGRRSCAQSPPQQQQALVTKTLAIIRRLLRPPLPFARAPRSTAAVASSSSATASRTRARRATCTPALSGATDC